MEPKRFMFCFLAVLIVLTIGVFNGCTLIGYSVGSLIDNSKTDSISISSWKVQTIDQGSSVEVYRKHGINVGGVYKGLTSMTIDDYARAFTQNHLTWPPGTNIPDLKDTFTVVLKNGMRIASKLVGYDFMRVGAKPIDQKSPRFYYFQNLSAVENNGSTYSVDSLENVLSSLEVPLFSSMLVDTKSGTQNIALNDIQQIKIQTSTGNAATIGLLVGIAVDAVVVVSIIIITSKSSSPPPSTQPNSCPFIYSFDGSDYVLDSETFAGSILKSLQRTDFDNLEHLAEVDGTYRLKLSNKLQETEYVDELKLLVVDHPKDTKVIPTFEGNIRVLSDLQKPVSARDYQNNDVLPLVASSDDACWVSNPLGRNPDQKSTVRDGLVLSFARPSNKNSVKLVFNIQNTPWATEMEAQLLSLKGHDLGQWYDAVNDSRKYLDSFIDGVKREAMLQVSVWTGQSWTSVGHIWFVGPYVSKTQVLELTMDKLPPDELRIRLESTAGLWMINSVNADFTSDGPITLTEISLDKAVDHFGNDIRTLLCAVDDQYYVLNNAGYEADLGFKAPPRLPGMDRSMILKSTGYYTIHVLGKGEPHNDLVKRLGNEPGAFGSYSIHLLNNYVSSRMAEITNTKNLH